MNFNLDSIAKNKILKGALIAGTGTGAIAILEYLGQINWADNGVATVTFVSWFVPTAVNIVREWMRSEDRKDI